MKLNEIRDNPGARRSKMRICRGIGSGKGKTGGRGGKGQTARSGVAINGFEGGQMPIYRRLPKRGFTNIFAKQFVEVNLGQLQSAIDAGKLDAKKNITAEALVEAGLVRRIKDGIRLLGKGEVKAKINIQVAGVTKSAQAAIEKVGGAVEVIAQQAETAKPVEKMTKPAATPSKETKPIESKEAKASKESKSTKAAAKPKMPSDKKKD